MNPYIYYVGGSSAQVGKTFVALGLLHILRQSINVATWKPVDVGHIVYNSKDQLTDAERLHQSAGMVEHVNLVNPYLLNENLPPVLAARRDGIRLDNQILQQYFDKLCKKFEGVVIEGFRGLHVPVTETSNEIDLIDVWKPKVLWVTNVSEKGLADTLLQVDLLKQKGITVLGIILTNRDNVKNTDLIHYQWLTLEEQLSVRVIGLLPYLPTGLEDPEKIGALLRKNLDRGFLSL